MTKLREQYVQNEIDVFTNLIRSCIEPGADIEQFRFNNAILDMLLEGVGVTDQFDSVTESRRFLDISKCLQKDGYILVRESIERTENRLKYRISVRSENRVSFTLDSVLELEDEYAYSKCSVTVNPMIRYRFPKGCGLSVQRKGRGFVISTGVIRIPKDLGNRAPYVSRLTGYRLFFS